MYATYANVQAAIQALQARGEKITTRAVREAIGGGSLEDIGVLIGKVLMNEPSADDAPTLPSIPYDLPEPDPDIVQRHLAELEGEAQALALMDHLATLISAARAIPPVGGRGMDWLFRRLQTMGEIATHGMSIRRLADDLQQVSDSAAAMLTRMQREYARIKGDNPQEGQEHEAVATSAREQHEGSDAEPH